MEEFLVVDQWNFMTANVGTDGLHSVGDVEQSYRARLWRRQRGEHAHAMRLSHDYRAYEIETSPDRALQTNGHLHRLALGVPASPGHGGRCPWHRSWPDLPMPADTPR